IWGLQNAEKTREEQRRSKEIPEFAAEFSHSLAHTRGRVVRTRGIARLDKAHDAAWQAIQNEHEHAAQEELPNLGIILSDVGVHQLQHKSAHDRTEESIHPTENAHEQHLR